MKALAEGLYIKHFQYGLGVITGSDSERTSIDFDLHGLKKFVTSMMVVEPAEGTPPKRSRVRRKKKLEVDTLPAIPAGGALKITSSPISDSLIVQFVGYEVLSLVRQYKFSVRESKDEAREFTLTISNASFDGRRARFQDAPDICSLRLRRELAADANHPSNTHFEITDQELDDYRGRHSPKPSSSPYKKKVVEEY